MSINKSKIPSSNYHKCKLVLELLCCNSLWIMRYNNESASILFNESSVLEHYLSKKYYLYDPNINIKPYNKTQSDLTVSLGTDSETFNKSGFLYDLYKIFNVEEFASVETRIGTDYYCFRFFTMNNRFIFINKIINDMQLIKHFINDTLSARII